MEDDWNDGQAYVFKLTSKNGGDEFISTAKIGEAKSAAHKIALEQKIKNVAKDTAFGTFDCETKVKNSGEIALDMKHNYLQQFEGCDAVRLLYKQSINKSQTPAQFGFSYMNDTIKFDNYVEASGTHGWVTNFTWRCTDSMIFGGTKTWKNIADPMNNVKWGCGLTGHFDKTLHWGVGFNGKSPSIEKTALDKATLYFKKEAASKTVGAEMNYDMGKKAFDCKVGLELKQSDHTWKLRLHDSGLARAALQWQLHKVCKATVDTSVDVKQALGGSITSLPLGFSFDVKY